MPPVDGDWDGPSDEEQDDDNILDQDYMPQEIVCEIEIQYYSEDNTEESELSDNKRWRKKSKLFLDPNEVLPIPEEISELNGLHAYEIFTKYLTPEI